LEQGRNDLNKRLASDNEQISALSRLATSKTTVASLPAPLSTQLAPAVPIAIAPMLTAGVPTPFSGTNKVVGFVFAAFALLLATFFWYRKHQSTRKLSQQPEALVMPVASAKEPVNARDQILSAT